MTDTLVKNNRFERKEEILRTRAILRQNPELRNKLEMSIKNLLADELSIDVSQNMLSHMTVALDDELNDSQAHVLL